jgi:hypothetical protein
VGGSDVHCYDHGRIGPYVVDRPLVLGHEAGRVVVALGPDVDGRRLQVGMRVSLEPGVPCRCCEQCPARYNLCPRIAFATPPYDGAFVELVAHSEAFVHPVPDTLSHDASGLLEPLSVGVWAARRGASARAAGARHRRRADRPRGGADRRRPRAADGQAGGPAGRLSQASRAPSASSVARAPRSCSEVRVSR